MCFLYTLLLRAWYLDYYISCLVGVEFFDYMYAYYLIACCMTALFYCLIAWCISMWDIHISPVLRLLVSVYFVYRDLRFGRRLVSSCLLFDRANY